MLKSCAPRGRKTYNLRAAQPERSEIFSDDESFCVLYQRAHRSSCQRLVAVGGVMHSLLALSDDGSALDEASVDVLCFGDGAPPEGEWRGATPLRRARDAPCAASVLGR